MDTETDNKQRSADGSHDNVDLLPHEKATFGQLNASFNNPADVATSPQDQASLQEAEQAPGGWTNNTSTSNSSGKNSKGGRFSFFRKKSALGVLGILGIGGGFMAFTLPMGLPIALTNMMGVTNNSSGITLSGRAPKVLHKLLSSADPGSEAGLCSAKKISCKNNRLSRSALNKLNKVGIVPIGANNKPMNLKGTGRYTRVNPKGYSVDLGDGRGARFVEPKDLKGFLTNHHKLGGKVYGTHGILNMRVKAWAGKGIAKRFYTKAGLKRDGGLAKNEGEKGKTANERRTNLRERMKARLPGLDKLTGTQNPLATKLGKDLSRKMRRGNAIYTTALATCLGLKAPTIVAAGVAGQQLLRLLPLIMMFVLSPGSQTQASGVNSDYAVEPDGIADVANELTAKDENGKSALDAPALQAAIGINSGKLNMEEIGDYIPGYSILNNPVMSTLRNLEDSTKSICNVVTNPISMYVVMAVDTALKGTLAGVATSLITIIASFAVDDIFSWVIDQVGTKIITEIAENDNLDNLQGEELGQALGISAMAFYSAGGVARFIPTMTTEQAVAFQSLRQEQTAKQRQWDVATLSPFDISSPYTFLGSINNSLQRKMITSGAYSSSTKFATTLKTLFSLPATVFSSPASADAPESYCSYAAEFGFEAEDGQTRAVTASGLPCVGFSSSMTTESAEAILLDLGWLNDEATSDIPEDADIEELVKLEVIKIDTPLYTMATECGDALTGSYLFTGGGCVVSSDMQGGSATSSDFSPVCTPVDDEGNQNCSDDNNEESINITADGRAFEAAAAWLIDYQVAQSIQGFDEETAEDGASNQTNQNTGPSSDVSGSWTSPIPSNISVTPRSYGINDHPGTDFAYRGDFLSVCDGTVIKITNKGEVRTPGNWRMSNQMSVDCGGGIIARYHHYYFRDVKPGIKVGAHVSAGTPLAAVGNQGNSQGATGYHLHLEIRTDNADAQGITGTKNPIDFLRNKGVSI